MVRLFIYLAVSLLVLLANTGFVEVAMEHQIYVIPMKMSFRIKKLTNNQISRKKKGGGKKK